MSCIFKPLLLAVLLAALPLSAQTAQEGSGSSAVTSSDPVEQIDPNAIRILLSPEIETTLVAQMAGSITALNASLGQAVSKGSPLVSFDCREGDAKLHMAEAELASARETLKAKKQLRQLEAAGDLEVALAAAAADRAKAAIALSRAQLSQCTVLAPFSGRIVKVYVKPYQGVSSGIPLLEMVNDGPLKIRLNVPSKLLRTLQIGTAFEVDIYETGKTYPARVTAINARVDAVAQTIELEAAIAGHPEELLAGMTGIARIKSAP